MTSTFKQLFVLFKGGIVIFVIIAGLLGYGLGYNLETPLSSLHLLFTVIGLAAISAGSFSLNQTQEVLIDREMDRTKNRPVASGWISSRDALFLSFILIAIGTVTLYLAEPLAAVLGVFTVCLYNGFYTLLWKKKWAFGAVPGAIPGAMPVVIGYGAAQADIFTLECVYLFLILFLWQMPHFWAIAIKLKNDYASGGVPVLPVKIGVQRTIFHIGLYTFVYVGVAMASPWLVPARYAYLVLVWPMVFKLLWEFAKYLRSEGEQGWLSFFLWTNLSVLIFLFAPVVDKWVYVIFNL